MKKIITLVASLLFSISVFAGTCEQLVPFGFPTIEIKDTTQLCRISYVVEHDNVRKTPVYSAELLLKENSAGTNKRINAFKADPDLLPGQRAELSDYDKTFDRGHMTPFEDAKANSAAALQTFYLSNMVPQNLHLNRGTWHAIENHVRRFAAASTDGIFVITGPVYSEGNSHFIGDDHVAVPDRIFKVVIDKVTMQGVAFLVPNTSPQAGEKWNTYMVPISEVEKTVNINFTPILTDTKFKDVIGPEFQ